MNKDRTKSATGTHSPNQFETNDDPQTEKIRRRKISELVLAMAVPLGGSEGTRRRLDKLTKDTDTTRRASQDGA